MTPTSTHTPTAGALRTRALVLWRALPGSLGADWLSARGISTATARRYGVGYDRHRESLCFPLHDAGGVCALSYRHIADGPYPERWIYPRGSQKGLFGAHLLTRPEAGASFVLLCEGESDALVAAEALSRLSLLGMAIGLPGAQLRPEWVARAGSRVVLCAPDRDLAGGLLEERALAVDVVPLRLRGRLSGGKDLSDLVAQPGGDLLLREAIAEALVAHDLFHDRGGADDVSPTSPGAATASKAHLRRKESHA